MPFRRSNKRPINSEKHEITWSFLADASAGFTVDLAVGTKDVTSASEVRVGSVVNSVFVEFNVSNNASTLMVFHWKFQKSPFGTALSNASTYDQVDKRFTFKRGMEMLPNSSTDTMQIKRIFVIRVPPRFRRMGDGDKLQLQFQKTSATGTNLCGIAIYKEYF